MKYSVDMPFTGHIWVVVEADNPEEALDKAMETNIQTSFPDTKDADVLGMEFHRMVVEGNVFHGVKNYAEVTEEN